jgi:hypothetical protein
VQTLTVPSDDGAGFGASVAVSGSTAVIATVDGGPGNDGAAYVFTKSGTSWTQQAELIRSGGAINQVAIAGNTIALAEDGANSNVGKVFIFTGAGANWTQQAVLAPGGRNFGFSIALSGNVLAATSVVSADPGASQYAVWVYTRTGTTWSKRPVTAPTDGTVSSQNGPPALAITSTLAGPKSVAVEGSSSSGYGVLIFMGAGTGGTDWSQSAFLTVPGLPSGADFGASLSGSDGSLVVGAPSYAGTTSGAAYVFVGSGASWTQQASFNGTADLFGATVVGTNNTVLVRNWKSGGTATVEVFTRSGATWSTGPVLSDGATKDGFGASMGTNGAAALVGAALGFGNVYAFRT